MHTCKDRVIATVGAVAARLPGVAIAVALVSCTLVLPDAVAFDGSSGGVTESPGVMAFPFSVERIPEADQPPVHVLRSPDLPNSYRGWTTRASQIDVVPPAPGTVLYTWDAPIGGWRPYEGTLYAPTGKQVLHVAFLSASGELVDRVSLPVKTDFDAPIKPAQAAAVAAMSVATTSSTDGSQTVRATGTAAGGSVTLSVRINPWTGARIVRLGGTDRYETSAFISAHNYETADTVIIATGQNFADALSASGLAGCADAPVLITRQTALPAPIAQEIIRLEASKAIIVGGTAAVGPEVAGALGAMGLSVDRIGGSDRYATAALIGARVISHGQSGGRVFIARGDGFADALSLGPLAYTGKAPLILVRPTSVPPATRSFLSANSFSSGCLAGGTAAVSGDVAEALGGYVPGLIRLSGDSRYSTAVAIAQWGVNNGLATYGEVGIATGVGFADALCGGVATGANGGVILLTQPGELPLTTQQALAAAVGNIEEIQVFGGTKAVGDGVVQGVTALVQ